MRKERKGKKRHSEDKIGNQGRKRYGTSHENEGDAEAGGKLILIFIIRLILQRVSFWNYGDIDVLGGGGSVWSLMIHE